MIVEPLDMVFRLKFDAALQDHVAKKATNKRAKAEARKAAAELRERAKMLEQARTLVREPSDLDVSPAI